MGYFAQQERRVRRGKLKPYTLHRDRRCYVAHLEEFFGHLRFEDVDEQDVAAWIDGQLEAGAAPKRAPATGTACCPRSSATVGAG